MKYLVQFNQHAYWDLYPEQFDLVKKSIIERIENETIHDIEDGENLSIFLNDKIYSFKAHLTASESLVSGEQYAVVDLEYLG
ncbi:hypothetical protein [Arachidicoccus sp.]|jgi:hypothetical protein|uniref:hypothetical protein n=1 Tax=Arachidicoccus sp. TaxID=1872624 RepID=UPI003D1F24A2